MPHNFNSTMVQLIENSVLILLLNLKNFNSTMVQLIVIIIQLLPNVSVISILLWFN